MFAICVNTSRSVYATIVSSVIVTILVTALTLGADVARPPVALNEWRFFPKFSWVANWGQNQARRTRAWVADY